VQDHRCDLATLDADPQMRVVARAFRHAQIGFGRAENIGKRDHANVILRDDEARAGSPQLLVGGLDDLLDEREYPFLPLPQRSALQAGKLLERLLLNRRLFFRPLFLRHSAIPGSSQSALKLLVHCGVSLVVHRLAVYATASPRLVGWVERSETHRFNIASGDSAMGFAALNPSLPRPQETSAWT